MTAVLISNGRWFREICYSFHNEMENINRVSTVRLLRRKVSNPRKFFVTVNFQRSIDGAGGNSYSFSYANF